MLVKTVTEDMDKIRCFDVLSDLRPHLSLNGFLQRVSRMEKTTGYQLACLEDNNKVKTVTGFRISEWLHTGKYLEIEDLITADGNRSRGYGGQLFVWILRFAKEQQCDQMRLASGMSREDAHQFYMK